MCLSQSFSLQMKSLNQGKWKKLNQGILDYMRNILTVAEV
jgi:hypothetical protein